MLRAARNLARLFAIGRVLAAHDALFPLEWIGAPALLLKSLRALTPAPSAAVAGLRPGERLVSALQRLGPSFIKLGQALSVRSDLVGEDLAADLSALQDRLTPFPGAEARRCIEVELGRPIAELFQSFGEMAFAAASIAQVHRAVTTEGRLVAVKVLRPGVEAAFARDLDLFAWLAETAERARPSLRRLKPGEVVAMLRETVENEMDLRFEAAAADELRRNFADDALFRVPEIDWRRTARRVMTASWVEGTPIDESARLIAAGHNLEAIISNLARAFFLQVFRDGFFHADLHPGNLLIDAAGAVNGVDFGIMGRLDKRTRLYLAEMLLGFLNADYRRVAEIHIRAGYVPADQSVDAFAQACRSIAAPILGLPLCEISLARLLAQLFQITTKFRMETQPHLLLLQKTMLVAEGVSRRLLPDLNMWELARPLIVEWAETQLTPEARMGEAMSEIAAGLERLPQLLTKLEGSVGALSGGGLKLHPDSLRGLAGTDRGSRRISPLLFGLLAIAAALIFR